MRQSVANETSPLSIDRYGPLVKDPPNLLDLPKGFAYQIISRQGDEMDDGIVSDAGRCDWLV